MGLNLAETGSADLAGASPRSRAYPWAVFALVLGLLLSDYMSRQVLSAVFPQLKAAWTLTDAQLGSLSGVVALMVGILTMPLSLLADRRGRARSIALMAVVWSIATLCCGFAANYGQMLAARFFVGVGEAAYGSVGLAVIMSVFPPKVRATLAGAFTSAGIFGAVLGTALGGSVATHYGWRAAFSVMAVVGLVVTAVYSLTVTERRLARHIHPGAAVRTRRGPFGLGHPSLCFRLACPDLRLPRRRPPVLRALFAAGLDAELSQPLLRDGAGQGGHVRGGDVRPEWYRYDALWGVD